MTEPTTIYERPAELLQDLIRFNTTNPPGNEAACIAYIDGLLRSLGIKTTILAKDPNRPNLIARLKGDGSAPPLLLQGHVDVVTTAHQQWTHPPFAAEIADGYIWGRGALDMKGAVAMMLTAFMRARVGGISLPGDVILALVSDEEADGEMGAEFLVTRHADLFDGVRYAIGESGGYTQYAGGRRFYPIMVAEKQFCQVKGTINGPAGHGAAPRYLPEYTTTRLGRVLTTLNTTRLPVHVTRATRLMIERMRDALPGPEHALLNRLLDPAQTDQVLGSLGDTGLFLDPLLHNTVSPTIFTGSDKINVIPAEVTFELDGRLLPGFTPDDLIAELHDLLGNALKLSVVRFDPALSEPDMGLFDILSDTLREADPEGIPLPLLLAGVTDGRYFARLGIQTYGFTPMQLPPDAPLRQTVHAADERIPVESVAFGADAIFKVLQRFH